VGVLLKKDIIGGIKSTTDVYIPSLEGEVKIRPISSLEWEEAQEIESKAFGKIKTGNLKVDPHANKKAMERQVMEGMNIDMDLSKMNKAEFDAKVYVVSMGLSVNEEETWTKEDVHELLDSTVNEIYDEVLKLSGIPQDASEAKKIRNELESFPEDPGGDADSNQ
jgi:hypothetical protein